MESPNVVNFIYNCKKTSFAFEIKLTIWISLANEKRT
jgi:hypothetical protein